MLMTAVALPIGGTTHADDPARVLTTAVDYGDEFVFERWGGTFFLRAKVTSNTINYADTDEFVVAEAGRQSMKHTPGCRRRRASPAPLRHRSLTRQPRRTRPHAKPATR